MDQILCPTCDAVLTSSQLADGWCEACGKKIPTYVLPLSSPRNKPTASDAPPEPPPEPTASRMPRPALRRIIVFAVLGLAVLAGVLYFILKPDVWIYVDNGATEAMVVKLNGADELTVQPRRVGILKCRSGTKRITVTAGGVTVFDETKTLGGGDGSAPYKYLLNPGATGRYWEREVHYGTQFPAFRTYSTEADHYQLIASNVHLLPVAPWLAGKYWDYVLEEPPDSVKGVKGAFGDSRYVISRIQREDYDLIAGAGSKHSVTSQEMQNLEAIVDRLLKTGQ